MSESINSAAAEVVEETTPDTTQPTVTLEELQREIDLLKKNNEKLKQAQSNASADASKYKKELQAKMSEDERKAAERLEQETALREELAALKREKSISDSKGRFLTLGFDDALAQSSAEAMAENNYEAIFTSFAKFLVEHDKALTADKVRNTPIPVGGNGATPSVTKEQFNKMGYREMLELKQKNPELYESLR